MASCSLPEGVRPSSADVATNSAGQLRRCTIDGSNDPAFARGVCRPKCTRSTWALKRPRRSTKRVARVIIAEEAAESPKHREPYSLNDVRDADEAAAVKAAKSPKHREPISLDEVLEAGEATAKKAGLRVDYGLSLDAEVQVLVLERLGILSGGVKGQRPLSADEAIAAINKSPENLAQRLMGSNSFDHSLLPMVQDLDARQLWPLVLEIGGPDEKCFNIVPTLELCAAICTRILCVARRLHKADRHGELFVLGIGDGTGILEASVALHLGIVMQWEVDLTQSPIKLMYAPHFEINIMAVVANEEQNIDDLVHRQMPVKPLRLGQVALIFKDQTPGARAFVLVDGFSASLGKSWIEDDKGKPRSVIEEICILSMPFSMQENDSQSLLDTGEYNLTTLFPKTLCWEDFVARGFSGDRNLNLEAGLFHSQLHLFTRNKAQLPFLVPDICHSRGPYDLRMKAHKDLKGLHLMKLAGIPNVNSPAQLEQPLPEHTVLYLKERLYNCCSEEDQEEAMSLREHLQELLPYCRLRAHKQLSLLLKHAKTMASLMRPLTPKLE